MSGSRAAHGTNRNAALTGRLPDGNQRKKHNRACKGTKCVVCFHVYRVNKLVGDDNYKTINLVMQNNSANGRQSLVNGGYSGARPLFAYYIYYCIFNRSPLKNG